jgi:predicted NBD/HSP70 family sugar kinase
VGAILRSVGVAADMVRELNRAAVLDLARSQRVFSRVSLSRDTGLSKATISAIIDELIGRGLIRTAGLGPSAGGRRPVLLRFDPGGRFAVGLEVDGESCVAVLTGFDAEPLRSLRAPVKTLDAQDTIDTAGDLIAQLTSDRPAGALLGVGVGAGEAVDPERGLVRMAGPGGWRDVPIGARLAERLGVPVAVLTRARAVAVGEGWSGAARGVDDFVVVHVGVGISAGIVVNGRLYFGASGSEGAFGHVTVVEDGPLCRCGNRGCLETVVAEPAIAARVLAGLRAGTPGRLLEPVRDGLAPLSLDTIARAAAEADPVVTSVLDQAATYLGSAAANLVGTLNPARLILGGPVVEALPGLVDVVAAVVRRRAPAAAGAIVEVVPAALRADGVSIGAAAWLLEQVSVVSARGLRPLVSPPSRLVRLPALPPSRARGGAEC